MAFNGTVIGTPTFSAAKFSNGLAAPSDANYISLPTGLASSIGLTCTMEAWVSTSASGTIRIAFSFGVSWFGILANNHFGGDWGGFGSVDSGITINNGGQHHVAAVFTATSLKLYVDGVLGSTTSGSFLLPGASVGNLGRFSGSAGFAWSSGTVDEFAVFNIAKYSSTFTPPTSAYTGSEANLIALYHLQSDGTDSAVVVTVPFTNTNVFCSPFTWYSDGAGSMLANNVKGSSTFVQSNMPGAYIKTTFTGGSARLTIDTSMITSGIKPILRWSIDNGDYQSYQLVAADTQVVLAYGLGAGNHTLFFYIQDTDWTVDRWSTPIQSIKLTALVLDGSGAVSAPSAAVALLSGANDRLRRLDHGRVGQYRRRGSGHGHRLLPHLRVRGRGRVRL
jgi:hypothetical protein